MDELNREKVCKQNEKSVQIKKRGAPVGNKNAAGHGAPKGNRNSVGYGAPKGNRNAVGNKGGARLGNQNARRWGDFD